MGRDTITLRERTKKAAGDSSLEEKLKNVAHRQKVLRKARIDDLGDFEIRRREMNAIKEDVLQNHDEYLESIKKEIESSGGQVHFAKDAEEARKVITKIAKDADAKICVKAKSMTSEEIELTPYLEEAGLEVWETDLGEYILQLANEKPSHIIAPAIHKTKDEISLLFCEKLGIKKTDDPEELTRAARKVLREKFLTADVGISSANAVIAENGTVVLVENEGNIRLTTTLPQVHIALVGIEKIISKMDDAAKHLPLLVRSATGQKLSIYTSFIKGPRRPDEIDGAKEFHLVFLDNGRSKMKEDPVLREALKCIRCGSCLNACPVYQHIGGHAYSSVYPGPIGAMITHTLATGKNGWELPFVSSLCGACSETCPANIPIHKILIELRKRAANGPDQKLSKVEGAVSRLWAEAWSRPSLYSLTNKAVSLGGSVFAKDGRINDLPSPLSKWTDFRSLPEPAKKSFREKWKTRQKETASEKIQPMQGSNLSLNNKKSPKASIEEIKKKLALPNKPRPGDSQRLMNEMKLMRTDVCIVEGIEQAREKLFEIFQGYSGKSVVRWDHPDLDEIGVDEIAGKAGVSVLSYNHDRKSSEIIATAKIGVTSVDYGLSETGTLVLMTAPGKEKSVSVLPPVHIAFLKNEKILKDLPDLFTAIKKENPENFRGMTFISGPSLTGDIEMIPVHGVHGPGKVFVVVY